MPHRSPVKYIGHSEKIWDPDEEQTGLSIKQLQAIELTARGLSDMKIAKQLSIDRKTLWRWKTRDEIYRRMLAQERALQFAASRDRYQSLLLRATAVLGKFLNDESESNRFRAATALLNMAGCFKPGNRELEASLKPEKPVDLGPLLPYKMG